MRGRKSERRGERQETVDIRLKIPLPRTESLVKPDAVYASNRVRNLNVYGRVNKFQSQS